MILSLNFQSIVRNRSLLNLCVKCGEDIYRVCRIERRKDSVYINNFSLPLLHMPLDQFIEDPKRKDKTVDNIFNGNTESIKQYKISFHDSSRSEKYNVITSEAITEKGVTFSRYNGLTSAIKGGGNFCPIFTRGVVHSESGGGAAEMEA